MSQYNLPELGTKRAYTANRHGGAERFADPAVQQPMEVDWALLTHDDQRLTELELSLVKAATHHDAHPLYRLHTVPGMGTIRSLVRLYEIHDMDRFPRVQDVVSYGRPVKRAKESAGQRLGTAGTNLGHTPSRGPVPKLRRYACASIQRGKNARRVWSIHLARATPSPSWPPGWRERSTTCASAKRSLVWRSSSIAQGAGRVSPTPHWTPMGSAARARARSRV
jgi:Transposase IS116/IS110/IS902 family